MIDRSGARITGPADAVIDTLRVLTCGHRTSMATRVSAAADATYGTAVKIISVAA
jgi:hypothetical protein